MEEYIFVVIIYRMLVQQKYWKVMLMITLRLTDNKWLRCQKREYIRFKNYIRKIKLSFMIYTSFESITAPEDNG